MKSAAVAGISERLAAIKQDLNETGLQVAINMKHEMPNEWHLLKQTGAANILLDKSRLPYLLQSTPGVSIEQVLIIAGMSNEPASVDVTIGNGGNISLVPVPALGLYKEVSTDIQLGQSFSLGVPQAFGALEELMLVVKFMVE